MSEAFTIYRQSLATWLEVSGEDSPAFLQSQFSNDLRASPGGAVAGLWLDHRGRLHGDSVVLRIAEEQFFLASFGTPVEGLRAKLEGHVIADEVEFAEPAETICGLVVMGNETGAWIRSEFAKAVPAEGKFMYQDFRYILRDPWMKAERWWILSTPEDIDGLAVRAREAGARELEESAWTFARLRAGQAIIPEEVGPGETPLEAGLGDWCSLQKGCYLGQEVVNRQARLERTARALTRLAIEDAPLPGGAGALPLVTESGDPAGELRAWASSDGETCGLAMVKRKFREDVLYLRDNKTTRLHPMSDA